MGTSRISGTARRTVERIAGLFDRIVGDRDPPSKLRSRDPMPGDRDEEMRRRAAGEAERRVRFAPDDTQ
jgi:hypothetical protein